MWVHVFVVSALHLAQFLLVGEGKLLFFPQFAPCLVPGMLLSNNAGRDGRISVHRGVTGVVLPVVAP